MKAQMIALTLGAALITGCRGERDEAPHEEPENWAVTAWGVRYEIFAECEPLIVGSEAKSHTHVTILSDFSPLRSGSVSAVLRDATGRELVFTQPAAVRDGIFSIVINPTVSGEFDLAFSVSSAAGDELIPAGRVRVGAASDPGGLVEVAQTQARGSPGGQPISFLKEQQWRTAFHTQFADLGAVHVSVRGPAKIRAAAGAEAVVVAPLDGILTSDERLYVGESVDKGEVLLRLAARANPERSLQELEAEVGLARARLARLETLLEQEAVSAAEVEAARAKVAGLEPQLQAAQGLGGGAVSVRSPIRGKVASVQVVLGQAVSSGEALARVIRTPPFWIEAALQPADAVRLREQPFRLVLTVAGQEPVIIERARLRLVSRSPEVDRGTGKLMAIVEVADDLVFPVGVSVDAEILFREEVRGIVIPTSSLVDDAGVPVIYVQIEGESFDRREVIVRERQGEDLLVTGVQLGERIVTIGGATIRRAQLMGGGEIQGHVH